MMLISFDLAYSFLMQSLELFGSALFLLNASLFLLDLSLALLLFQALPLKLFLNALFFFEFLYIT
jgi:hypothetical protein